jgi:hypothetical protein
MYTTKVKDFKEWISVCSDVGFNLSDITENDNVYEFKNEYDDVLAYWDRKYNFGAISIEVFSL